MALEVCKDLVPEHVALSSTNELIRSNKAVARVQFWPDLAII